MSSKICNICNVEKPVSEFRVNHRRCKACVYEINKTYSKTYYQQNKKRLIEMNKNYYKLNNAHRGPNGRPRKYNTNMEEEEMCLEK